MNEKPEIAWLETLTTERILTFKRSHAKELYGGGYINVQDMQIDAETLAFVLAKREHIEGIK